jgi:hypothetical protein
VDGDRLDNAAVMATKRACVATSGTELEASYLDAIERARRYRIASDQLELLDADGRVVARFV